jgi:hypothetical protein
MPEIVVAIPTFRRPISLNRLLAALGPRKFGSHIAREVAKIVAALLSFPVVSIMYSLTPTRRLEGLRRVYRAAGKIGALFGHRYHEYSAHHGR